MIFRNSGLIVTAFAMSVSFTSAAFAHDTVPDDGGGGDDECTSCEGPKGNNGWGNGSDEVDGLGGTNNGSEPGVTGASKSKNGYGTGPGPSKFTER